MFAKTCLITGATSGIGRAAALALGGMGAKVILVGRNELEGGRLATQLSRNRWGSKADFLRADLSDQRQVRELAATVGQRIERLDVLINNAGARINRRRTSIDGIEMTFASNHLGHFLLTALLLDRLVAANSARVINVCSGTHAAAKADGAWGVPPAVYDPKEAYARSKLANVLFTYELARRMAGTRVSSNGVDPGIVATRFARNNGVLPWVKHLAYHGFRLELKSPSRAAGYLVRLASSEELNEVTGKYFVEGQEAPSSAVSLSRDLARALWAESVKLTHLDQTIGQAWDFVKP